MWIRYRFQRRMRDLILSDYDVRWTGEFSRNMCAVVGVYYWEDRDGFGEGRD